MRKTGNKKKEISRSKRTIAICLSMAMILGSVSFLAFADETDEETIAEDTVIEEAAPAAEEQAVTDVEAEPETAEPADEEEIETADADAEIADEEAVPAEEEQTIAAEEVTTGTATTRSYAADTLPVWYVGDRVPGSVSYKVGDSGSVGVTARNGFNLTNPRGTTGGYSFNGINGIFIAGSTPIGIKVTGGSGTATDPYILAAVVHVHAYEVTSNGATAKVACTARGCSARNPSSITTVTISAPGGRVITYDGTEKAASLTTPGALPDGSAVNVSDITYTGEDTEGTAYESTSAPVDAGSYTATATVSVGESSADVSVSFTINKARINTRGIDEPAPIDDSELTDLGEIILPEGEAVALCVAGEEVEGAEFVYSTDGELYTDGIPEVGATGDYTVYYRLLADKNHTLSSAISGTIDATVMNYEIAEGADATWQLDSTDNVVISVKRSTADDQTIDRFTELTIDDAALVEDTDFTKEAGSVVLTIKAEALQKLSAGEHTVKIGFVEGIELEAKITIKAAPSPAPQTGEYAGAFVLVIGAVMAAAGAAFVIKARKA